MSLFNDFQNPYETIKSTLAPTSYLNKARDAKLKSQTVTKFFTLRAQSIGNSSTGDKDSEEPIAPMNISRFKQQPSTSTGQLPPPGTGPYYAATSKHAVSKTDQLWRQKRDRGECDDGIASATKSTGGRLIPSQYQQEPANPHMAKYYETLQKGEALAQDSSKEMKIETQDEKETMEDLQSGTYATR